ncbi:MAG: YfhO family protein [Verrucomicrobia bacterium]|nr:YfhO family protein [Verrucomicrobiota bacterium]
MKQRSVLGFLAALLLVLGFLFREVLLPGMAGFANDAPLGLMQAYSDVRWDYFLHGSWLHNVWVGGPALNTLPNFSHGLYLLGGALVFAKFAAALSMAFAGWALWVFCRRQGFHPVACALPGLAMALNGNFLSHATWGLGSRAATVGFAALALAAVTPRPDTRGSWVGMQFALAGFATGMTVMEGADVGAFFSVLIAAYLAFDALIAEGSIGHRILGAGTRLALVVVCAVWISALALSSLVGTQIKGIAGMGRDTTSRQERWEFVTGWSFPKLEIVRLAIPGIMGLRSISPGEELYWGNVGSDGSPPRFNGGSEYAGVLVLLLAGWSIARASARTGRQPFSDTERKRIGFWGVVALVSLLLSFGHYAPFYQLVFALPYFSTIRVPMKLLHLTHLALLILFAYGLEGLWRLYLTPAAQGTGTLGERFQRGWRAATGFDRAWGWTLAGLAGSAALFALAYASYEPALVRHLATLGFTGGGGQAMAAFSVREVALFGAFTVLSCGVVGLVMSGAWSGRAGLVAGALLGGLVVLDLGRAMAPFVLTFNHQRRYEPNAVTEFLRQNFWEHRVVARPHPQIRSTLSDGQDGTWPAVHNQWLENQMPYNQIQTLDIWQMPRQPEYDKAMLDGFRPTQSNDLSVVGRLWDLTNVRYVIGSRAIGPELDRLFAKGQPVFRPAFGFDLAPKPGATAGGVTLDDITAVPNATGQYAVFENTRALPRVRLFTRWESVTNDVAAVERLKDPSLDIGTTLVLDTPTTSIQPSPAAAAATASIRNWSPTRITVGTESSAAGILMLNERWHPDWQVSVDGTPAELLRANLLMRAVAVPSGSHTVEFRYRPTMTPLWITLSAFGVALALGIGLVLQDSAAPSKR